MVLVQSSGVIEFVVVVFPLLLVKEVKDFNLLLESELLFETLGSAQVIDFPSLSFDAQFKFKVLGSFNLSGSVLPVFSLSRSLSFLDLFVHEQVREVINSLNSQIVITFVNVVNDIEVLSFLSKVILLNFVDEVNMREVSLLRNFLVSEFIFLSLLSELESDSPVMESLFKFSLLDLFLNLLIFSLPKLFARLGHVEGFVVKSVRKVVDLAIKNGPLESLFSVKLFDCVVLSRVLDLDVSSLFELSGIVPDSLLLSLD